MAFEQALTAFRHADWSPVSGARPLAHLGADWSGAEFKMVFSQGFGEAPILTLGNAARGQQGIHAYYDAGMVHPKSLAVMGGTYIERTILRDALEDLADPAQPAANIELAYTFYATPAGSLRRVVDFGIMTIRAGVPLNG